MSRTRRIGLVVCLTIVAGACASFEPAPDDPNDPNGTNGTNGTSGDGGRSDSSTTGADATTATDGAIESESGTDAGRDGGGQNATCDEDDDCEGRCVARKCTAPTHTDGKISPSLGETDIDCGGPTAPACSEGDRCVADDDCSTATCSASKRCVTGPSCRGSGGAAGVDTCIGSGGKRESCCRSLPLPARTTRRLDKYAITSGRLRAFIAAVSASYGGVPNVRAFVSSYVAAHPTSQLGVVAASYPGLLAVLPDHAGPTGPLPLPVFLGAFPLDPINALDGCFTSPGDYGHATYWQPASDVRTYGIGIDGVRKYSQAILDEKPVNCVMPMMLAAFCAWDGGELARTADYREVWGRRPTTVGGTTVYIPWAAIRSVGEFDWRNGHGGACSPAGWPGCRNPQGLFFSSPAAGHDPSEDDTPAIGTPGAFPLDVTAITSGNGEGWLDIAGTLMESAWPVGAVNLGANPVQNVCDQSASVGPGETACSRRGVGGVRRYQGALPHIALVGYSFEGHARRSEQYLASTDGAETRIPVADLKPITFQYGKLGGRCAR